MADNDTQYGNILRVDRDLAPGEPAHHKVSLNLLRRPFHANPLAHRR
jgi:hypothetical protein